MEDTCGWKRRMGVHLTYHQNFANKMIHFVFSLVQLVALVKLVSLFTIPGTAINLGLCLIIALCGFYFLLDKLTALILFVVLFMSWAGLTAIQTGHPLLEAFSALFIFALAALIQVKVGHGIFEKGKFNLGAEFEEFFETKNPIIFVMIYMFPLLDVLFMLGHNPNLKRQIEALK